MREMNPHASAKHPPRISVVAGDEAYQEALPVNGKMKILLIHQNFPGQFRHVARQWSRQPGWQVVGLGRDTAPGMPDIHWLKYRLHREPKKDQHPYLRQMENAVLHGQAVARVLLKLKRQGFTPDIILAHPGWGETLYVREVFPHVRLIHLCEWYYETSGADVGFDPEFPVNFDDRARVSTWNALHTLNLENCDQGISPTAWQKMRHPATYHHKIAVIHEGIDTGLLGPDASASFETPSGNVLKAGDPVITYVSRNLEPYRGFHIFMRALERIQAEHKTCHAVIVGGDDVSYGRRPKDAPNWREKMLREVKLDPARTHFLGKVPYDTYRKVLQISAAHAYLTYPFVLSWSMLEAMASGCLVIGSDTAPVREMIRDQQNGLLADFFDRQAIAEKVMQALETPQDFRHLRTRAREDAALHYNRQKGLDSYRDLIVPEPEQRRAAGNLMGAASN